MRSPTFRIASPPLAGFLGLLSVAAAAAQTPASTAKALQGDFAVPDAPAILMLNGSESTLLRPSSAQQLTSSLASGSGDFTFIPKALGVEFSPAMVARGDHLSIGEYQANPMLYRTRVSFATGRDSTTRRSQVALAFRMSLDDQSDLRTNTDFLAAIDQLTSIKVDSLRALPLALIANHLPVVGPYTPAQQKQVDAIAKAAADSIHGAVATREAQAIAALKRARESARWNANVTDVAIGVRGSSTDSSGTQSRFDGVAAWLTKGWSVGAVSQLLVGLRGAYDRDSTGKDLRRAGDAVVRMYSGSNTYKVSLEGQAVSRASARPKWGFKLGGEFEVTKSVWVELASGWMATGASHSNFTHSVKFQLAPPNS